MTPTVKSARQALRHMRAVHRNHPTDATWEAVQVAEDELAAALAAAEPHIPAQRTPESMIPAGDTSPGGAPIRPRDGRREQGK